VPLLQASPRARAVLCLAPAARPRARRSPPSRPRPSLTSLTLSPPPHRSTPPPTHPRFKEDVSLMRSMGIKAYRFSISWARLFPTGRGPFNEKGAAFYDRLISE
jgi:hypothetical protein